MSLDIDYESFERLKSPGCKKGPLRLCPCDCNQQFFEKNLQKSWNGYHQGKSLVISQTFDMHYKFLNIHLQVIHLLQIKQYSIVNPLRGSVM